MHQSKISLLKRCDIKIPKKGAKIKDIADIKIFIRRLKRLTYVYEVTTGLQLMCVVSSEYTDEQLCDYVHSRQLEVEEAMRQLVMLIDEDGNLIPEKA